jgi:hypothetical protein
MEASKWVTLIHRGVSLHPPPVANEGPGGGGDGDTSEALSSLMCDGLATDPRQRVDVHELNFEL